MPKVASYAAAIKEACGIEPEITTGTRGQFDIQVDGKTVVSRKGGLLAILFRKPWPSNSDVLSAINSTK